jgi:hypothetical protein
MAAKILRINPRLDEATYSQLVGIAKQKNVTLSEMTRQLYKQLIKSESGKASV